MRLRLRRLWVILAVLLCIGGAFGLRGIGQKGTEAAGPGTTDTDSSPDDNTTSETTTPPDANSGQFKMWFDTRYDTGDVGFVDTDGLSTVQWNMKYSENQGFNVPNSGTVRAFISIDGQTPSDLTDVVTHIEWKYTVTGLGDNVDPSEYAKIVEIMPKNIGDSFDGGPEKNEMELMINPKSAGLVEVNFTIKGTRINKEGQEETPLNITRTIIIGSPLRLYSYPEYVARDYTEFYDGANNNNEVTVFANNSQNEACQIYWFYLDAKGNYHSENPAWIGLEEPTYKDGEVLPNTSDIVEMTVPLPQIPSVKNNITVLPYTLKPKNSDRIGGFTRIVGRIYLGGDSRAKQYVESTYDVITGAKFRDSADLELTYGQNVYFNTLANDRNNSLGWISYQNHDDKNFLEGAKPGGAQYRDGEVLLMDSNGITAQNFGEVTLEATALFLGWEDFDNVVKNVTALKTVKVASDVLKGKTQKTIIDNVEVISVGGTIPLSTNIVSRSDEYEYTWEYLPENVVTGSALQSWRKLGSGITDARFSVDEVTTGNGGITGLTISGKTSGSVKMKCTVRRKGSTEPVLEKEFDVKIVDTMTLSETSKTIAVGGKFDIEAFVSGLTTGSEVEWSVINEDDEDYLSFTKMGATMATVTGLAPTNGRIACRATAEINGTTTSATFYVTVIPAIDEAYIQPDPSATVSVGGSAKLDLILKPDGMNYTKDQIKWVLKDVRGQGAADTIIKKVDSPSNFLQATVTGLAPGEAYVAVVTNDAAQTEIAVITIKVVSEVDSLTLSDHEVTGYLPGSYILTATLEPEGFVDRDDLAVVWEASNDIVTITPDPENTLKALVTYNEIGNVRVTATVSGLPAKADFCIFTIENAATGLKLDPTECKMRVGETRLVTATIEPPEVTNPTLKWESRDENIATVSQAGVITAISPGTTFITCTTSNGMSQQVMVTVLNPVEKIELNYTELTVKKGTVFFLSANVLPEDAVDRTVTWSSSDEGVCTVDEDGTVTANTTGQCIITATSNDNPEIKAECRVTVTESVAGITLNYREKTIDIGETFVLKATVLPSDANDRGVTFTSSNPAVATVDANGLVTGVSGGTTIIVVRTNDRGLIATCTVTVRQDVTKITFDVTDIYLPKGETRKISYTIEPPNATISDLEWSSSDPSIAFVDSEGYVHGVALGEVTITATAKDGSKISATCKVTVINPVTEIRLSETSLIMMEGDEHTLTYIISPQNASVTNVKWTSSDVSVATVNSLGIVKALREGETRIRVEATDNSGVYAECIVVVKPYIPITSIRLNSTDTTMILGESRRLTDRTYPNNTTERAEWRSSDTGIVTVDGEGNVVAVGPGTCTITKIGVTSGIEGSCTIHVIGLTATEVTIEKYDTFDLYLDDPDADIRWFSRDKRTATVNRNGVVTGRRPGTTYIVADLNGKLVSCRVTVVDMNRSQQDTINAASNVAANTQ